MKSLVTTLFAPLIALLISLLIGAGLLTPAAAADPQDHATPVQVAPFARTQPARPGDPLAPADRTGELLYEANCQTCHLAQVHWRQKRLATDWATLRQQIRRWQKTAGLQWGDEQIDQVAHYLNFRYYRYQAPERAQLTWPRAPS